jgi:hypothetical protein
MFALTAGLLLFVQAALCSRRNIVFILTDDQDLHMESVQHMPHLTVRITYPAGPKSTNKLF